MPPARPSPVPQAKWYMESKHPSLSVLTKTRIDGPDGPASGLREREKRLERESLTPPPLPREQSTDLSTHRLRLATRSPARVSLNPRPIPRAWNNADAEYSSLREQEEALDLELPKQIGPYRIEGRVAPWARGSILRAFHTILSRPNWVKTLSSPWSTDEGYVRRFQMEAHIAAALNHPNIIQLTELGECDGIFFQAFAAPKGRSLSLLIQSGIDLELALRALVQVLGALEAIHARDVLHRAISPASILVADRGDATIADFSLASVLGRNQYVRRDWNQFLLAMGTPCYLAPEQDRGEMVDPRTDIFAVGCLLYDLVTGDRTFNWSRSLVNKRFAVEQYDLRSVPEPLRGVVERALQQSPKDRYPDAGAMRADLERARTGPAF